MGSVSQVAQNLCSLLRDAVHQVLIQGTLTHQCVLGLTDASCGNQIQADEPLSCHPGAHDVRQRERFIAPTVAREVNKVTGDELTASEDNANRKRRRVYDRGKVQHADSVGVREARRRPEVEMSVIRSGGALQPGDCGVTQVNRLVACTFD